MSTGLAMGRGSHLNKGIMMGFLILLATFILITLNGKTSGSDLIANFFFKKSIYIDDKTFHVWVAKTDQEREEALNNKDSMPEDSGMIFVFDQDGIYPVSVSQMHFPVDIIWLSQAGSIVAIENEVSPARAYPARPSVPARYVLLLSGGVADKNYIGNESHVNISNIQ
ncbi:MAG: DUF192 domain-containing protein [Candidatus Kaiserbacteria bacterium]|nr:DUF192 domain-containing protein [Candidatus Kaiserbacteria bacterium]